MEMGISTTKGQIMSECIYEIINFPKNHRKILIDFCQNFLNGPVKDCLGPSYTDRFKTKRQFITKNANVAKLDSFIYCNP